MLNGLPIDGWDESPIGIDLQCTSVFAAFELSSSGSIPLPIIDNVFVSRGIQKVLDRSGARSHLVLGGRTDEFRRCII